ncbi:MAG TPA: ATP-binding cassette domain-containing protein [Cytophagales bacterium]|nr:ATP-binding cassette domain-containing protein [Cytophagales bacterium]
MTEPFAIRKPKSDDPQSSSGNEKVIEFIHVRKSFGNKQVLTDINFELHKQQNAVVLGKSGTGKSVFIQCIVGLAYPDAGVLKVFGTDILDGVEDEEDLIKIRRKVGFLFQGGALYDSMTVKENLEFPLKRQLKVPSRGEIKDLVLEALESVGLVEARNKMPAELSGGMKKRIALARTLILKPEIMLYDEPTTGLDPVTSREISELILEMQEKYHISSIIITHDISCAKITANRIYLLKDGVFYAEGAFDELEHSDDPWIRAFFE